MESFTLVTISLTAVFVIFFIAFVVLTAAVLRAFAPVLRAVFAAVIKEVGADPVPIRGFVDSTFIVSTQDTDFVSTA